MEHKLATDQVKEQAALYALGALSQIEARAFENHLDDGCDVCRTELAAFEGVVDVLGLGAPPASPPAHLRELVMTNVVKEPRGAAPKKGSGARAMPPLSKQIQPQQRSQWTTALPWAIAACLAIAAVSSLVSLRRAMRTITVAERELRQAQLDYLHVNEELAEFRRREGENLTIISLLQKPGSSYFLLAPQKDIPPSKADAYLNRRENMLLVAAQMAPAPPGKVYQLWFLAPTPRSAGLIPTDTSGHGFAEVNIPADLGKLTGAAITLEPEGGSTQPTLPIYVHGAPGAAD